MCASSPDNVVEIALSVIPGCNSRARATTGSCKAMTANSTNAITLKNFFVKFIFFHASFLIKRLWIKMYRCRAITPPLYNTKRKNGYPTFCSAATFFGCPANYVPHFPDTRVCRPRKYGASADRENTAKTAMSKTVFGCLRH